MGVRHFGRKGFLIIRNTCNYAPFELVLHIFQETKIYLNETFNISQFSTLRLLLINYKLLFMGRETKDVPLFFVISFTISILCP